MTRALWSLLVNISARKTCIYFYKLNWKHFSYYSYERMLYTVWKSKITFIRLKRLKFDLGFWFKIIEIPSFNIIAALQIIKYLASNEIKFIKFNEFKSLWKGNIRARFAKYHRGKNIARIISTAVGNPK